ncbi:uncharacterized protein LOC123272156 [Cotesia glomerata]|uniref:Uncharacterized protein n=1 Tax=Cotesia glomerata TaxID=32391 RepID=A0AAV7IUD1_COTGL|nr:uncharacterized protein LOC123272156 [Cotesia glomerata]KAH0557242.1 hypothetical protein KQX54_002159 [Cotesia glomerata]
MSVYVTVNPVCMRREKTVLSDREQIKKFERERRRRLRIEQVRQQSKDISSNLLERTKDIARKEINNLEKNQDSDLRRLHNKKLNEIQQRYQDEMNNIGLAHESASIQPQSQVILEAEKYKNHAVAVERGKEAAHLINTKSDNGNTKHQRLKQVRETENLRSAMIAGLPKAKSKPKLPVSAKKKKLLKNSPIKTRIKSPQHQVIVEVHQQEPEEDVITDFLCLCNDCCTCPNSERHSDNSKYNPEDYRQPNNIDLVSTTSVSDDSSYFSDIPAQTTNRPTTSLTSRSKNTQRTPLTVNKSSDLVERIINVEGEMNAQEAAQQVVQEPSSYKIDESKSRRRGVDALLREKVKRDYNNLIKNLDTLSREERKLKASRIDSETGKFQEYRGKTQAELRNKRVEKARQKLIDRDFDGIITASEQDNQLPERIITLPRKETLKSPVQQAFWGDHQLDRDEPHVNSMRNQQEIEVEQNLTRDEQILEMLKKVERQKKLLLQEFGTCLPNEIFDASMTPLFNNNITTNQSKIQEPERPAAVSPARQLSPEIKVINLSNVSDNGRKIKLRKEKSNRKTNKMSDRSEIAVQTSRTEEEGKDKSIQVEMSPDRASRLLNIQDTVNQSDKLDYIEPMVTIITHPDIDIPTTERSRRSIVINVGNGKIQVTSPSKDNEQVRSATAAAPSVSIPAAREDSLFSPENSNAPTSLKNNKTQVQSTIKVTNYEQSPNLFNENFSHSSSSYASLGAIKPTLNTSLLSNITSILELLDLSENNTVARRLARFNVSPASTPETPSPRIINMRSNRPCPERIAKILEFTGLSEQTNTDTDTDTGTDDDTLTSQSHNNNNNNYKKTRYYLEDRLSQEQEQVGQQSQLDQQQCIENIQVIDALLNQHRNEASKNIPTNLESINQLIKAVDNLRFQYSPTARETTQRELNPVEDPIPDNNNNNNNLNKSKTPPVKLSKTKPKIIAEEAANVDIEGWRKKHGLEKPSLPSNDEVVAKLSQEILEQSKKVKGFEKKTKIKTEKVKNSTKDKDIIPVITLDDDNYIESHTRAPTKALKPENLSTIEELDTPDTGNQSQWSVRSPGKLKKVLSPETRVVVGGNKLNSKNNIGISVNLGESIKDSEKKLENTTPEKSDENIESVSSLGILSIHSNVLLTEEDKDKDREDKPLVQFSDNNLNKKSIESLLINCSARNSVERITNIKSDKITSTSSGNSLSGFSGFSGISDIISTPVSDTTPIDVESPPEKMEDYLKRIGLASLIPMVRKTREASALSSSSNSDITIALKRVKSPLKKSLSVVNNGTTTNWTLPGFSDVSSISIKETTTNKSTEKTVLMKARTSTPNIPNYYSLSEKSSLTTTTSTTSTTGGFSLPEHSDSVIATNLSVYLKT